MSGERVILTLFAQVALILALTRISGWIFSRFRQPQILGEMLAGIILGPSLLGWAAPQFYQQLFPQESLQFLAILAQIGAVFFVFLIGLQLDPALVRTGGKSAAAIALSSILFSFGLALLVTVLSFSWSTALFIATALTASSFPVLGRILSERNLHRLQIGPISIAAAALSNLVTWAVVAAVIVIAHLSSRTLIAVAIYFATLALLIRPFLNRLLLIHEQRGKLGHNVLAAIFFLLVLSSLTAHRIGLHAFFGALILGLLMPKNPKFIRHLSEKLQDLTHVFLLPVFLAYIGLNTNVALINRPQMWGLSLLILAIACIGKIGGTVFAARLSNIPWRDSTAVGVLLNTRGLMLVFIISIGLELQLIPPAIFAILVLIGLTTTAMTTPLLNSLYPAQSLAPEQSSKPSGFSILIPISLPKSGGPLVQIADALIGPARQIGKLLALHLRRPNENESFHAPDAAESEALIPLLSQAQARSVPVEPITFVSNDIPADIAQTVANHHVNLVLMGYHNPIFGKAMLGGTVHRVLTTCPTHVAVFVDRGLRNIDRILVPYLGSAHDALALELAARIVRNTTAQATVLHVVPPMTPSAAKSADAKRAVEKIFETQTDSASVSFQVVEDSSPVGVVLHRARDFDLVIIGVAEQWGLESRLFGWRPEKIARDCPASLLIVRNFAKVEESTAKSDLQQPAPSQNRGVAI